MKKYFLFLILLILLGCEDKREIESDNSLVFIWDSITGDFFCCASVARKGVSRYDDQRRFSL